MKGILEMNSLDNLCKTLAKEICSSYTPEGYKTHPWKTEQEIEKLLKMFAEMLKSSCNSGDSV